MHLHRFLVLFITFGFLSNAHALNIVLDPGHGGTDRGANRGEITESQITLQVAQLVANELRKDNRFKVIMTRENDAYVSLEDRASLANTKGDLFLSIHVNSSDDVHARGQEIYFQNQLPSDQEALFLASRENDNSTSTRPVAHSVSFALKNHKGLNSDVHAIVEDLERNHQFKLSGLFTEYLFQNWSGEKLQRRHSIRQAPFFVVSNIDKPAALIEIGYLSNPQEAKRLTDPQYQKKIAMGIFRAITNFKEFMDRDVSDKELIDKSTQKSLN